MAPAVGGAPRGGAVAVHPPLGLRLARTAARIPDARFLDRLLRGRAWIGVIAVALMGVVFIQVSMLRLNSGISRAITSAETLNRQNAGMRAEISKLDSGERIADSADALGMIQPAAGSVNYLDARKANGRAAAQAMRPPKAAKGAAAATTAGAAAGTAATQTQTQAQAPAAAQAQVPAATTTQAQAATAPAATTPPATTQPATTQPTATQPAPTTAAPATTQAQTAPPVTQTQQTQAQTTAPVNPAGGTTAAGTTATGTTATGTGGQ